MKWTDERDRELLTRQHFPTKKLLGQPLWRYLTFEKFVSLLQRQALWFSRLGSLQDKFEGKFPRRIRRLAIKEGEKLKEIWPGTLAELRAQADQRVEEERRLLAVNCWFAGEQESLPMWRQYTDKGQGVALRSTVMRLRESLSFPSYYILLSKIVAIKYVNLKTFRNKRDSIEPSYLKDRKYRFEQEVRAITLNHVHGEAIHLDGTPGITFRDGSGHYDPERKGFYLKCDLRELIEAVYVSPFATPEFSRAIQREARFYGLTAPLRESKLEL